MSALTSFLLFVGKNFGAGALGVAGNIAASALIPILVPKVIGAVRGFREAHAAVPEDQDPDLC